MAAPEPTRFVRRQLFDLSFFLFLALAVGSGLAVFWLKGSAAVWRSLEDDGGLFLRILPQMIGGLLVGGFVQVLVPRDLVARWLGRESGLRGIAIATVAGAITPGGPIISFPLVVALGAAGADIGALVAYVTAWSTIGLNRIIIWELPFMGGDFALVRFLASLPLPFIAALIVRRLPPFDFATAPSATKPKAGP